MGCHAGGGTQDAPGTGLGGCTGSCGAGVDWDTSSSPCYTIAGGGG
ncbi:hypothetical protein ACFL0U_04000 [Pseudomonadota bacterium]